MKRPHDLRRRLLAVSIAAIAISSSEAFLVACRRDAPRSTDEDTGVQTSSASATADAAGAVEADEGADAAGNVARGLEARAEEARRDAGAVGPACEGPVVSLLAAAVDPRCAVTEREWTELTRAVGAGEDAARTPGSAGGGGRNGGAGTPKGTLRQQARREGDHVVLSIVNASNAPVVVPLRYHPGHPELAFSVLAESEGRGVFELAAPANDAPASELASARPVEVNRRRTGHPARPNVLAELDAGALRTRVHSAHIRLPPGGVARARLTIDPRIVKRLDRTCAGAGARPLATGGDAASAEECSPARLPKGRVVLYVGQLVTAIDSGEPARVEWDAP